MRRQKSWLDRLSSAARWRLGAKEAEEVIGDYRELVGGRDCSEEVLMQDVGAPLFAVKLLTEPGAYRVWLAVFAALAVCLAVVGWCAVVSWSPVVCNDLFGETHPARIPAILVLSTAATLAWFRWKGRKGETLPRGCLILLAVELVWIVVVMSANWAWMHDSHGFAEMWGKMPAPIGPGRMISRSYWILGIALQLVGGAGMAVLGIIALVKARMGDRRWAAVYILAMTAVLVSLETLLLMNNAGELNWENSLSPYFFAWAALTAVGIMGTGVALW